MEQTAASLGDLGAATRARALAQQQPMWRDALLALLLFAVTFALLTRARFDMLWTDGWIGSMDLAGAYAASLVFQGDAWHFPPGANPLFGNTSVVYSDSIPLAALAAKLFTSLIGQPVFYIGGWFCLNIVATAFVALRIGSQLALPSPGRLALAVLLTANVIALARMIGAQHLALSSTWLLLVAILLTLRRASPRGWCLLLLIAAGVHAYLLAMCLAFYGIAALRDRHLRHAPLVLGATAGWMFLLGYAYPGLSSVAVHEFKAYAADLGFFFNSFNWALVPELFVPAMDPQRDALLYVGTGALLLLTAAAVALLLRQTRLSAAASLSTALVPAAVLLIFATGLSLHVWGHTVADVTVPPPFDKPFRAFRAIGRFGWPASYLLIVASVVLVASVRARWATVLLLVACVLQLADVAGMPPHSMVQPERHLEAQPRLAPLARFIDEHGERWNGQVYKFGRFEDFEALQFEDAVLAKRGARFSITHSGRQSAAFIDEANRLAEGALAGRQPGLYVIPASMAREIALDGVPALLDGKFGFYLIPDRKAP
ncbi:DUF6311 domain-containing protein [Paracidovorax citrulli]